MSHVPHPHAYEWHDGHTSHHGGLAKDEPKDQFAHPTNDQAAKAGVPTYAQFAQHYGSVTPGQSTNLNHYDYAGKLPAIKDMVKQHGYQTYYAGGQYGKPDLANKNYNTGHLMIYDPTPAGGGDFGDRDATDSWRQVHELAHALTYPELNSIYGEGRRMGKLGMHRTPHEAKRAVHWEWLAAHKQRELSKQLGVHLPDDQFHKELNTVMHDALHRAVTGRFTDPAGEGFTPHDKPISLEHALNTIDQHAGQMGLGQHDTFKAKAPGTLGKAEKKAAQKKAVKKPSIPGRSAAAAKPKTTWKSKDGVSIPAGGTPARKKYDERFKDALIEVFAYGNPARVKEVKVPVNKLSNTNMPVNKDRLELYRRMAAAGERLPPVVVRPAGNGVYRLVDGNHRHTAAVEHGYKHLDAIELVDPNAAANTDKPMKKSEVKKMEPLWLNRLPVLHDNHLHDLDTRAAINEFDRKMPREEAEAKAHKDYMAEHHAMAAAHHLSGMKAAQAIGNMEEAKKHGVMYGLHAKALGHDPVGPVPPEVQQHYRGDDSAKVYKFKAHKADRLLLGDK